MEWVRLLARTARRLLREPGFTGAALLLLALGTGLTTAAFALLDRLLWQPTAGVPASDRLVALSTIEGGARSTVSAYTDLQDLAERGRAFAAVGAFKPLGEMQLGGAERGETVRTMLVTPSYFAVLGLRPTLGRFFTGEESTPGVGAVAVLGHELWRMRFGGRSDVIGRTVSLDGVACTVVGVAPPGFAGTSTDLPASVFLPMAMQPVFMGSDLLGDRGWSGVLGVARLRAGVTLAAAASDLRRVSAELARELPRTNADRRMTLAPLRDARVSGFARSLWLGAAATTATTVALVLLVACANVAALLGTRALGRRVELAVRRSLGATPRRLAIELGAEALLLAVAGGALGLVLARGALALLERASLPALHGVTLGGRALPVATAATLASALLAGLTPLAQARRQLQAPLRSQGATRVVGRSTGVALQLAVSLVLLVGVTLFARTLAELQRVPLGFSPQGLLTATIGGRADGTAADRVARWQAVAAALHELPGVEASLTSRLPGGNDSDALGARLRTTSGEQQVSLPVQAIGAGYFHVLGVRPLVGREIEASDERTGGAVAVANELLVRRYWGDRQALGERIDLGGRVVTIVGVVPNVRDGALRDDPAPLLYLPWSAAPEAPRELYLLARPHDGAAAAGDAVRRAAVSAGAARVRDVASLAAKLDAATARERVAVTVLGALAALALLLTAVGLYSLLAWTVAQRKRELGVRAALGAGPARLRRLVVAQALRIACIGIAGGVLGGLLAARAARAVVFGFVPYDPLNLLLPAVVLVAATLGAAWWPARRATRTDPMAALRG